MRNVDVAVVGAGAAGMMCAATAGGRGRTVLLLDHATRIGEKIRISGGGRCNFTNAHCSPANFLSENPDFCRSALARYTPADFVALVERHGIRWHEKHRGQLFCDESADQIIEMLRAECDRAAVRWMTGFRVERLSRAADGFRLDVAGEALSARSLVIATGGLSIPKLGATDFGYRIARQFGLRIVEPRPALVPLTFDAGLWLQYRELAGVSLEARVRCVQGEFLEDLLFTHRGLSGPAVLQISSYWRPGRALEIDLAPGVALAEALLDAKRRRRQTVGNVFAGFLPRRLAELLTHAAGLDAKPIADVSDGALRALAAAAADWRLVPAGSEGYRKAEVTAGGVDTRELSSTTMEARNVRGLHFVGEVLDVTGHLGGHNFQWAWASGRAAGLAV